MKKADAEKLVRPTSVEESIEYDLVMPVVN